MWKCVISNSTILSNYSKLSKSSLTHGPSPYPAGIFRVKSVSASTLLSLNLVCKINYSIIYEKSCITCYCK